MNKDLKNSFWKCFYSMLGILSAIMIFALLILSLVWLMKWIKPNFYNLFASSYFQLPNETNSLTTYYLQQLIAKGKIISVQDAFGYMISFYDTLITFLIGILGVFGVVSWISLTGKVRHDAEKSVDEKIQNEDFRCRLNQMVKDNVKSIFEEQHEEIVDEIQNSIINYIEAEDGTISKIIEDLVVQKIENKEEKLGDQDGNKV